jgi:hypothetical protein
MTLATGTISLSVKVYERALETTEEKGGGFYLTLSGGIFLENLEHTLLLSPRDIKDMRSFSVLYKDLIPTLTCAFATKEVVEKSMKPQIGENIFAHETKILSGSSSWSVSFTHGGQHRIAHITPSIESAK